MYPLGIGTTWQDHELLYSLRSLHAHVAGIDRVIVVGQRPAWLKNVVHLPAKDPHSCKERNIMEKILRACEVADGPFLFANDDHFALAPQPATVPYWRAGPLGDLVKRMRPASHYRQALANTDEVLRAAGKTTHNFDVHLPIVYDPVEFPRAMGAYDWKRFRGYVIKSLYANTVGVPAVPIGDVKLGTSAPLSVVVKQLAGRPWFSTGPGGLSPQLKGLLAALYPTPSPWETT